MFLIIRGIISWFVYMTIFVVAGAAIRVVATAFDARRRPASDLEGLGGWVVPMLFFWAICILAAALVVTRDHAPVGILNALAIFLPGGLLGSASVFMVGPLWSSRRRNS